MVLVLGSSGSTTGAAILWVEPKQDFTTDEGRCETEHWRCEDACVRAWACLCYSVSTYDESRMGPVVWNRRRIKAQEIRELFTVR